ncbi:MAG: cobalamin-binding protein [Hyphomicrobium sp.]|nr:cobalamin-binding protein [Hyphomicrobium sp.]PPD07778.1 MAG: cobalamin-binding protein [Hyphomicrobium sp.]
MSSIAHTSSSPRVISLIASATEILHALGAGGSQVARSHECDYPPGVLDLPQLTRAKFKVHGATSAEIDRSVKGLMEQGLAVYEVDADRMRALAPDVILTQDQCEVCAVSLADVEAALCTWTDSSARIVSLRPHTLSDVYADIVSVAEAIGRPAAGAELVASMQARIAEIAASVEGRPRRTLGFVEWIEPPMSGGHWMPELITAAGGISPFGVSGENSPWVSWEDFAAADPDILLVGPCGYEIATSLPEMEALRGHPVFKSLRAVREGRVFVADGNAFFNRPGPRLVESAEILAEIMHPDVRTYGHLGEAYAVWPT